MPRTAVAQTQNLLAYSYDTSNAAWSVDGITCDYPAAGIAAPDGTSRVSKLTEDNAVGARHRLYYLSIPALTGKGGGWYNLSGYFKAGTRRYVALYLQDASSSYVIFDLQNGVVVGLSKTTGRAKIENVGNGWYRCSHSVYNTTPVGNIQLYLSNGSAIIYNGDGASYVYAWGIQLVKSNIPGPYVDTNGAAIFTSDIRQAAAPVPLVNKLTDGDMEAAGVAAWTVSHSATLTKDSSVKNSGTQSLKIAYNGSGDPAAFQVVFTIGTRYRVHGVAKGNGVVKPKIYSGSTLWTGAVTETWQKFDIVLTATTTPLYLMLNNGGAGDAVWFDDVEIIDLSATPMRLPATPMRLPATGRTNV